MSVTSFGDLVIEAERVLTRLAATREFNAPALAAAWPDFCRRAIHAITAATGARDPRWYAVDLLVMESARPVPGARSGRGGAVAAPDPDLVRAGVLLGAAGDILATASRDSVADPMLADANIRAAQGRVAALLAAGAHSAVRALASHVGNEILSRTAARELAGAAMRVEQLAVRVFEVTPTTISRADDVVVVGPGRLSLVEAIDHWSREARDTVRSATPSARDLQGLAADLSRLATHSRAIARAAVAEKLIDRPHGQRIDTALAASATGWREIAEQWTGSHTAQPPMPSKIAASHALGKALIEVTRDGREWADPAVIAKRVDLIAVLAAVRRGADVARDVAERQDGLPERLTASGQLYAPAVLLAPSIERLHSLVRGRLIQPTDGMLRLASSTRSQSNLSRNAARLLESTVSARPS